MKEKIKALLENKEFTSKLAKCENEAALTALLAEFGVNITAEELKALASEKMSDEALADVAGGRRALWKVILGILGIPKNLY